MDSCDEQNSQYFKRLSELQTAFGEAYKEFLTVDDAHRDVLFGRLKTAESDIALYQTYGIPIKQLVCKDVDVHKMDTPLYDMYYDMYPEVVVIEVV